MPEPTESISGLDVVVSHVLYSNEENGWSVMRCRAKDGKVLTAVGTLLGLHDGDRLQLSGSWVLHAKFGEQFKVSSWVHVAPSTIEGIRRFLASGRIKGIGPVTADRIVGKFGLEALDIIDRDPEQLRSIRGVGRRTLERIRRSWADQRGVQQIVVFLSSYGVAPGIAVKLFKRYGAGALEVVRSNPYRLAEEVFGVGFLTADRIAQSLGMPLDARERYEAGILYALQRGGIDGHLFLPRNQLDEVAQGLLGSDDEIDFTEAVSSLEGRKKIVVRPRSGKETAVYSRRLETAEAVGAASMLRIIERARSSFRLDPVKAVAWYERNAGIDLALLQRQALETAIAEGVVIITGGPGTGKTTLIRGLTKIFGRESQRIALAAPTGRAAKRMQEATGHPARTIHRLLEFNPMEGGFARDRDQPLEADLVVVDEVSMLDMELAAHLFEAIPDGCRLVLVGDADQLPSVGPGNVLADLIASCAAPVIRLDQIFRQAGESQIVVNAHRINDGLLPDVDNSRPDSDFYFVARDDPVEAADVAVELAATRISRRFGFDPVSEIQLLTPMHRGEMGVTRLNERLQELLTPPGPELVLGARRFRSGDKIMQVRNNYDLDIFNGDLGQVDSVDIDERALVAVFDGRHVSIETENLDDLMPAYACTIHKSQGSEYPAVVILLHHHHHIMLQRNLLYTAITRGRRLVTIVGSRRGLERAVKNATVRHRHTMLAERLRSL